MKIDLQIHTPYSDGRNTMDELFEIASTQRIAALSVTDHDTLAGQQKARTLGEQHDIRVIPGIEITATYNEHRLHILGYGFDEHSEPLTSHIDRYAQHRREHYTAQIQELIPHLPQDRKHLIDTDAFADADSSFHFMPGIAKYLYQQGIVEEQDGGFAYLKHVTSDNPIITTHEAIDIIHRANGQAVISHPLAPKLSLPAISKDEAEQKHIFAEIVREGLDGTECYTSGHSKENIAQCHKLAAQHNLFITAGSDWHGPIERTGKSITKYLPYYPEAPGIDLSQDVAEQIIANTSV